MTEAAKTLGLMTCWLGAECFMDLTSWSLAGKAPKKTGWDRTHAAKPRPGERFTRCRAGQIWCR
jgi:hypothetical protein